MSTQQDYITQSERLAQEKQREQDALQKAHELHGGENPSPFEPRVPQIITQFGEWAVTPFGVECLVYPYQIQWDSLTDPVIDDDYWLRHLSRKPWVNLYDFTEALRHGRRIHYFLQNQGSDA